MDIQQASKLYASHELCVLPIKDISSKRPNVPGGWKQFQSKRPSDVQRNAMFRGAAGICIVCGEASNGCEIFDFDAGGEQFLAWLEAVQSQQPELWDKLVCEKSPSGGYHVVYRCPKIEGSQKLSQRKTEDGKIQVLIETKGSGGLFLCAPTQGYELIHNTFTDIQTITEAEREVLFSVARGLSPEPSKPKPAQKEDGVSRFKPSIYADYENSDRVGDDYSRKADVPELLRKHGWQYISTKGENQEWRRPGKTEGSISAHWNGEHFYCFTSSTVLEHAKPYNPFSLYAFLECDGDFKLAAQQLRQQGYGQSIIKDQSQGIMSQIHVETDTDNDIFTQLQDPGAFPKKLLQVDGLLAKIVEYNILGAYRKQPELALLGAIALMSILTAKSLRDETNTRGNMYLLGVCGSGEGKDRARVVNKDILSGLGAMYLSPSEEVSSDTAIIRSIETQTEMLLQLDEFGRFLTSMNNKGASHLYKIGETLLKLYSCSNGVFSGRIYADANDRIKAIKEPFLTVYGTTVQSNLWDGLRKENLSDGLYSRLLIVEGRQEEIPRMLRKNIDNTVPEEILLASKEWIDRGNQVGVVFPQRITARYTDDAYAHLNNRYVEWMRGRLDKSDFEQAMLNRNVEKARKLALIYAASSQGIKEDLHIDLASIEWACEFVDYCTRLMIYKAESNVSENKREKDVQDILRFIRKAGQKGVSLTQIARKYRALSSSDRRDIIQTLCDGGDITVAEPEADNRGRKGQIIVAV
jgi:hypothetical protein